jgi:hypothetical protein
MSSWLFSSLRGYRIGWLPRDLVAGLMLLAIAMPGQLATARRRRAGRATGIRPTSSHGAIPGRQVPSQRAWQVAV